MPSPLAAAAETLLVRPVPPVRTAFDQVAHVTSGLTSILTLLLCLSALWLILELRRRAGAIEAELASLAKDLRPLAERATAAAEDVRAVTQKVDAIVGEVHQTASSVGATVRATADLGRSVVDAMRGRRKERDGEDRDGGDRSA